VKIWRGFACDAIDELVRRSGGSTPRLTGQLSVPEAAAAGSIAGVLVSEATLLAPPARLLAGPTHVGPALAAVALGGITGAVIGCVAGTIAVTFDQGAGSTFPINLPRPPPNR
jgi:hypothetical protein